MYMYRSVLCVNLIRGLPTQSQSNTISRCVWEGVIRGNQRLNRQTLYRRLPSPIRASSNLQSLKKTKRQTEGKLCLRSSGNIHLLSPSHISTPSSVLGLSYQEENQITRSSALQAFKFGLQLHDWISWTSSLEEQIVEFRPPQLYEPIPHNISLSVHLYISTGFVFLENPNPLYLCSSLKQIYLLLVPSLMS